MATPKGKVSKARRNSRRSAHWKLSMPGIVYDIPKYQENVVKRVSSSLQTWFELNPGASLDDFLKESDRLHIEMNKVQKYIVELAKQGIDYLDPNPPD